MGPTKLTDAEQMERRYLPDIDVVNLYDILPPQLQKLAAPNDTSELLRISGEKYKYQGVKKLAAAAYFDHDYALWLDSDAIVVQPFRIREVFDDFVKAPVIFTSRIAGETEMNLFNDVLSVLGRSHDSFAPRYFNIER